MVASRNGITGYCSGKWLKTFDLNLLLTMNRDGDKFSRTFTELFGLMAGGMSMLMAWVKLMPQAPSPWMDERPSTFLLPLHGDIKFMP